MRQSDRLPPDPEVQDELDAVDAALLGLRVDPRHAELAELTVLLADERPSIDPDFARLLDQRVAGRFAPMDPQTAGGGGRGRAGTRPRRRRALLWSGGGLAGGLAVAFAVLVFVVGGGTNNAVTGTPRFSRAGSPAASTGSLGVTRAARPRSTPPGDNEISAPVTHGTAGGAGSLSGGPTSTATAPAGSSNAADTAPATAPSLAAAPSPAPNGRRIEQSAQLDLTTSDTHIADVAQEVFNVVGNESGIVRSSSVTSGSDAYASFTLSIPSQNLQQTMTDLSELRYAAVASRTDATQDVNDSYLNDASALADARALRTSLLKQLANAVTQAQIESLTTQIHDAEASISSDEATLSSLQGKINFSSLEVQINEGAVPPPTPVGGSTTSKGFTIGRAAHDALRVLTVAAGVALIALAALVPFAMIAALLAWVGYWLRRRRREQALDAT